jgi:predicted permease
MSALLQVAVFLLLGRLLVSIRRMPRDTSSSLRAWVLYVAWPAAALQSASQVPWNGALVGGAVWLWAVFALAIIGVTIAIAFFKWSRSTAGAVLLASGAGSTAGFALPFIERFCGTACLAPAIVLSVLGGALVVGVLGVAASCVLSEGRVCVALIARRIVTFPPVIGLVLGALIPVAGLPMFTQMAVRDLADTLAPVSVVAIGMQVKWFPDRARIAPVTAALVFKLLLAPALVLLGLLLVGPEIGVTGKLLVLLAAMPPLISAVAIAREYDLEPELSAQTAALGSSLALITVPLWGLSLEYLL